MEPQLSRQSNTAVASFAPAVPAVAHTTKYQLPSLSGNWGGAGLYLTPRPKIPQNIMNQAKSHEESAAAQDKYASTGSKSTEDEKSHSTSSTLYEGGVHCQNYVKLPGYWTHERSAALAQLAQDKRITEASRRNDIAGRQEAALDKARKAMLAKRREEKENKSRRGIRAWFRRKI